MPQPGREASPRLLIAAVVLASSLAATPAAWCQVPCLAGSAKLSSPVPMDRDYFGFSVSIDGRFLAVGTPNEDGVAVDTGTVRVYEHRNGAWVLQDTLTAPDAAIRQKFGISVAISGRYLAVGTGSSAGGWAAYNPVFVFELVGDRWTLAASIEPSLPRPLSEFGRSLSLDGTTLVIGSPVQQLTPGGIHAGAAFVEVLRGGQWVEEAVLTAGAPVEESRFGAAIDLSGDRVIVGAPNHFVDGVPYAGGAWIFRREAGAWSEDGALVAPAPQDTANFGMSVGIEGDVAAVGAPQHDTASYQDGAAGVYVRNAAWSLAAWLVAPAEAGSEFFGDAIDVSDGRIAVGAEMRHRSTIKPGAVLVYESDGAGGWPFAQELWASDAQDLDHFGAALQWGDFGLVVGAYHEDGSSTSLAAARGAAYVLNCTHRPPEVSAITSRAPLLVRRAPSGVTLSFEDLGALVETYSIYEGRIGDWYSHHGVACNVIPPIAARYGALEQALDEPPGNAYWLVTSALGALEGTSGFDSHGVERPPSLNDCPP